MNSEVVTCPTTVARRARGCMYASSLLQGMVFFGPIATLYRQARGISIVQLSVIEAVCLIMAIALEIPWGVVADKIGYKRTLVVCGILGVVSKIIFWQAHSFGTFLIERIVLAVVMAGTSGVDAAYLSIVTPLEERQKVFGRYESYSMVGLLVASVVFSSIIKDRYDLAAFLTVLSYVGALVCILSLPSVQKNEGNNPKDPGGGLPGERIPIGIQLRQVLKALKEARAFLPILFSLVLLAGVNQTITVFIAQLRYVQIGMTASLMGITYILVTISAMGGAWLSHRCCRVLGERRTLLATFVIALCSCLLLASHCTLTFAVIAAVCLLRLSASIQVPLRMDLENRFSPLNIRATMLSCYAVIRDGAEIGTSLVFGALADRSVANAMYAGVVCCTVGFICILIVPRTSIAWNKRS